jgi:hypothetical protein
MECVNCNGLTYTAWLHAAGIDDTDPDTGYECHTAWVNGVDPTEYRREEHSNE